MGMGTQPLVAPFQQSEQRVNQAQRRGFSETLWREPFPLYCLALSFLLQESHQFHINTHLLGLFSRANLIASQALSHVHCLIRLRQQILLRGSISWVGD